MQQRVGDFLTKLRRGCASFSRPLVLSFPSPSFSPNKYRIVHERFQLFFDFGLVFEVRPHRSPLFPTRSSTISGSFQCAMETANICRLIIQQHRDKNAASLLSTLRKYGVRMAQAKPSELVIENVVRRVLHIVREEYGQRLAEQEQEEVQKLEKVDLAMSMQFKLKRTASTLLSNINQPGMYRMLEDTAAEEAEMSKEDASLKKVVLEEIEQLIDEFQDLYITVAEQAIEHIHAKYPLLVPPLPPYPW